MNSDANEIIKWKEKPEWFDRIKFDEYEKLAHVPSFGRLLASFPGDEGDIPARNSKPSRAVDL